MNALERLFVERIGQSGPMPFAAFMSQALYHPRHGYYSSGKVRTGWSGHFVTSPEMDPAFGELWCGGLEELWELCDRPARFDVIEIGPGEGSFAHAVLNAASPDFAPALHYQLVERVPAVERRQRERLARFERVRWARSLDEVEPVANGSVIANEVLDNLPVHLVEMCAGELLELCVTVTKDGLELVALPPASSHLVDYFERVGVAPRDGFRYEVPLAADSFVARCASALQRGAVVFIDYGGSADELAERAGGSLVCYSAGGVDDQPLASPGEKDITVHANWTAVASVLHDEGLPVRGPLTQRGVLLALGAAKLDARLKDEHQRAVRERRGADAVSELSRRQSLGILLDPGGLGALDVLVGTKAIEPPSFVAD